MSIEVIQALGDDALSNLFDMSIGTVGFLTDLDSTLLRVQNFTIPATGANTYEVHHKTQMMTKVGGKVDAPNEFTFDFRVDRNYIIYKGFVAWKNAVANSSTGVIGNDGTGNVFRTPITIWAVDSDGTKVNGFGQWDFKGCFVQNVGDISFDYTSGDPIMCTITMGFLKLDDTLL